jgi:hypothetical protein
MSIVRTLLLWCLSIPLWAGPPEVVDVGVSASADGTYRFDVTVRHEDEGWEHYADRFEVLTDDGVVLGTRVLHHPHDNEQPFTRSLSGVEIGPDLGQVRIRAHDSVHGYGEGQVSVAIPR